MVYARNIKVICDALIKHHIHGDNLSCDPIRVKEIVDSLRDTFAKFRCLGICVSSDKIGECADRLLFTNANV